METPNLLSETVYSTVAHALCAAAVAWGSEYTLKVNLLVVCHK